MSEKKISKTFVAPMFDCQFMEPRPTADEVRNACRRIKLTSINLPTQPFERFLAWVRELHSNGGAHLAAFDVAPDRAFDWFASRNRLTEEGLLDSLLVHPVVKQTVPELRIPDALEKLPAFMLADALMFDGTLARLLLRGVHGRPQGDGRSEKIFAVEVCDAMFGLRYGEVSCFVTYDAWTPWFRGIGWDVTNVTQVLFDTRLRRLWVFTFTHQD